MLFKVSHEFYLLCIWCYYGGSGVIYGVSGWSGVSYGGLVLVMVGLVLVMVGLALVKWGLVLVMVGLVLVRVCIVLDMVGPGIS